MGHEVWGVDISPDKVRMIAAGQAPVVEKGLQRLVSQAVREGKLRASEQPAQAVQWADISMICVGTPSLASGEANLESVVRVAEQIGQALRRRHHPHTVVLRSTVPPGTTGDVMMPSLERYSRKKAGRDFQVCFQPEFMREGSSVQDFFRPVRTVIGFQGDHVPKRLLRLWRPIKAPLFLTSLRVAEMLKYADNAFHALKVAFANEVGAVAKSFGIDGREVMNIFVKDKKLNISPLYLQPGFAFGGPCLPKDVRAVCAMGQAAGVEIPLLGSILESNSAHLRRALTLIQDTGKSKVAVLGVVFKSSTDDLRESPACALVRSLLQARKEVKVYDPGLQLDRLTGANRAFVANELPQLPALLAPTLDQATASSQVIVVASKHPEFQRIGERLRRDQILVDLVGLFPSEVVPSRVVRGLCW